MSRFVGIDPGKRNVGWAVFEDGIWRADTFLLEGGYQTRMHVWRDWCRREIPTASVLALEKLSGGQNWMSQELASVMALAVAFTHPEARVAIIHPSTHFKFVSGVGKRTPAYDERCARIAGRTVDLHASTAVGCVLTALADMKGKAPPWMQGKIQWAT